MEKKILYVGMDVHKKSIDVAITDGRANGNQPAYISMIHRRYGSCLFQGSGED